MTNAILLHGKPSEEEYFDASQPSSSNAHWFPWLQKQLIVNGIKADTPEVPLAYDPQWDLWVKEVERFEIGPETILVGHSCGGGFWVKYLSEHPKLNARRVILVAPSLGSRWDEAARQKFYGDFKIDPLLATRTQNITIFASDNDHPGIEQSITTICKTVPSISIKHFPGYGHFYAPDFPAKEFPELLSACMGV